MNQLKLEYELSNGEILGVWTLLYYLENPNAIFSKEFKETFNSKELILNELFIRWFEGEKEELTTMSIDDIEKFPIELKNEIINVYEEVIDYFFENYLNIPIETNFQFVLPDGKLIHPDKFAASFNFFDNHIYNNFLYEKDSILNKVFQFILKNHKEIEKENLSEERFCTFCGNEDNNAFSVYKFYFSNKKRKLKHLNFVEDKFIPPLQEEIAVKCRHREDWVEFVGKENSSEIWDDVIIDFCDKCGCWSIDDEEFDENKVKYADEFLYLNNGVYEEELEDEYEIKVENGYEQEILFSDDGQIGTEFIKINDFEDEDFDEYDYDDSEDDDEDNPENEKYSFPKKRYESFWAVEIDKKNSESFPFLIKKESYTELKPLELFMWKNDKNEISYDTEKNINEINTYQFKKIGEASLADFKNGWDLPDFFKLKEGTFIKDKQYRNFYNELFKIPDDEKLYFPILEIKKVKLTSKNKKFYTDNSDKERAVRWSVDFTIEETDFSVNIQYLLEEKNWKMHLYPCKKTSGICPYCTRDCTSDSTKRHECEFLSLKPFREEILRQILANELFKKKTNDALNEIEGFCENINEFEIKNISFKKYEFDEYQSTPKWNGSISYELIYNQKKYKKSSVFYYYGNNNWTIIVGGDFPEEIIIGIKEKLPESELLQNFLETLVKEKEIYAERPKINVTKIVKPKNKRVSYFGEVETDFIIYFDLIYSNETIKCELERTRYLEPEKDRLWNNFKSVNYDPIRKNFLGFDVYVFEELKNNEHVKKTLGDINF